jgi:hypothetical protein
MIQIVLKNEDALLNEFYETLTVKKGKNQNVLDRLNKRIAANAHQPRLQAMYARLKNNVEKDGTGHSILTAKPDKLWAFAEQFEADFADLLTADMRESFESIFYYSNYDKWNAYDIATKINLKVCPYCNRSYTFVLGTDAAKATRFEYDHFFAKYRYSYLALSFYNLIPSCHICNANLKKDEDFNLTDNIHPYLDGFSHHIVFSIKPNNIGFVNGKADSYKIELKKGTGSDWPDTKFQAARNNINILRLEHLYNMHQDYTDELIQKSIIYNKEYIDSLFATYGGKLFRNKEDVKRMVLGNYTLEEDYGNRPLSKLTADLAKELRLI